MTVNIVQREPRRILDEVANLMLDKHSTGDIPFSIVELQNLEDATPPGPPPPTHKFNSVLAAYPAALVDAGN